MIRAVCDPPVSWPCQPDDEGEVSHIDGHDGGIISSVAEDQPTQVADPPRLFLASGSTGAGPRRVGFSRRAGVFVALAGLALLWALDDYIALFAQWFPTLNAMKQNTAFGLTLAGLGLWLSASEREPRAARWLARLCGLSVAALGLAVLAQVLTGIDVGVDSLFADAAAAVPQPMNPNTALALLLAGIALTLLDVPVGRGPWPSQLLSLCVLLLCLEVLIEYLYGLPQMVGAASYARMPLSTAALLTVLGMGTLLARPRGPLLEPVMERNATGSLARRLLVVAVVVPLAVGFVQQMGLRADLYGSALGSAALVVCIILLLIAFIWFHSRQLARAEAQAHEARAEQGRLAAREHAASLRAQLADRRLRDIVQEIDAVVWEVDAETLRISFVSDQAVKLLGHAIERWYAVPGSWLDLIHSEDRQRVTDTLVDAAQGGGEQELEYRAIDGAGRTVWLRHRFAVVKGPAGRPQLRGLITDITAGKQQERRAACRHTVTQVLAESATIREAAARIIRGVCECLDWQVGGVWAPESQSETLHNIDLWHVPTISIAEFDKQSRELSLSIGAGLQGRVWASGEPAWIPDVAADETFPRAEAAARAGLHAAFGFPIKLGDEVFGVMEFFSAQIRSPDADVLEMMGSIGERISQFIERRRNEEAVRTSEERLRFALDAARTWTWDVHLQSGELRWSENAAQVLGLGADVTDEQVSAALRSIHPDDRARVAQAYLDALDHNALFDVEYRIVRAEVTERWAAVRGRALRDENGQPMRMLGVATDVTELKRMEMRLVEETETVDMVNRIGQMLRAELDLEKLVQAVTDAATRLIGARYGAMFYDATGDEPAYRLYTLAGASREAVAGFGMPRGTALFGPTFRGEGVVRLDDVGKDPRYGRNQPHHGLPLGHFPVASYLAVPVVSRSGAVLGGLFFAHPEPARFTEREERIAVGLAAQAAVAMDNARLYEVERAARAEAEAANRAKDEFLAMLGHELRNPIGAISNSIRVLTNGQAGRERTDALHAIVARQTRTLGRLVDDLLDVSRLTSGKIVLKREPVNLAEVAERCLVALRAAQRMNLHEVALDAAAVWVEGDSTRLEQVLANLLENALKYTAAGGLIALRVCAEDGHAIVSVRDTGRGIEPEMIPRIFDVFTQGPQSLDRAQGGLGIGLTLVKRLVELHGGEVEAKSEGAGRGSEFIVRLPLHAALEVTPIEPAEPTAPPPRRILVIEDYADARDAVRALLEQAGHQVDLAASGREGVEKAVTLRPEVALIDVGLPGLDGYEVARRIRRAPAGKEMLLIALTGYGQEHDRRRALEAGFDVHLVKPLDPVELSRALVTVEPRIEAATSPATVQVA